MIWISFKKWSDGAGRWFYYRRLYWKKYKWTPFIIISKRNKKAPKAE